MIHSLLELWWMCLRAHSSTGAPGNWESERIVPGVVRNYSVVALIGIRAYPLRFHCACACMCPWRLPFWAIYWSIRRVVRENKARITGQHFLGSDVIQIFCPVPACRLLSLEAFLAPRPQRKTELVGGRRPNPFYLTQQRSRFLAQVRNCLSSIHYFMMLPS